jgi:hypothetical protein
VVLGDLGQAHLGQYMYTRVLIKGEEIERYINAEDLECRIKKRRGL